MPDYKISQSFNKRYLRITDRESHYNLDIDKRADPKRFESVVLCLLSSNMIVKKLYITGRNLEEYSPNIREHHLNPNLRYLEVGPGLGEFLPNLVNNLGEKLKYPPIGIEPANYFSIRGLLCRALEEELNPDLRNKIICLKDRCDFFLKGKNLILVEERLTDALRKNAWLFGIADIVVDHVAASFYMHPKLKAEELEKKLLKPGGIFLKRTHLLNHAVTL
jgi:hypothetical protein